MNDGCIAHLDEGMSGPAGEPCANSARGSELSVMHICSKQYGFACANRPTTCQVNLYAIANHKKRERRPIAVSVASDGHLTQICA